jgi:hypothetical protein
MTFHPAPARNLIITITGKLMHEPGPWGSNRPVRRSANVNFIARESPTGIVPGQIFPLGTGMTDGDGNFSVRGDTTGIPNNVAEIEEALSLEYIPDGTTEEKTLDAVRWGAFSIHEAGTIRLNWQPPERAVAEVNGKGFEDINGFANQLAQELMDAQPKPYSARNTKIVLLREPSEADEYTRAQNLFKDLNQIEIHQDFPTRLIKELERIPMLRTNMKTESDAILNYLFKISVFQQYQFERGPMLETLVKAIGKSLGWIISEAVSDPVPDMAAACGLIYIAGRMAKDKGKMSSLLFGKRAFEWATFHYIKTVQMNVGR